MNWGLALVVDAQRWRPHRKKALTDEQVLELRQKRSEGLKIRDLMTHYSLSKATVYRALGGNEGVHSEH